MTTIAEKLTTINGALGDIKTAIEGKGVTPTGDITTFATAIGNISGGGGSFIGIQREVSQQGVYQIPTKNFTFTLPSDTTDVGIYGLSGAFRGCTALTSVDLSSLTTVSGLNALNAAFFGCIALTSVDLSSLTTVSGKNGLSGTFQGCTALTSVDLSLLTTVSGQNGLSNAFQDCTALTSVDLSSLTTVSGQSALSYAFRGCTALTSVDLSSLTTVSGHDVFGNAFYDCTALTDIYFRALTTTSFGSYVSQFQSMMKSTGSTVTHTLHFPSNLESTIQGLTGYPNFGGTRSYVVCAFDLPATS